MNKTQFNSTLKSANQTKNHPKTPKIRFKNFNDTWEQRELGKVAPIIMGQSPDGSTYSDSPSTYILVQGNADLKDGWVVPRIWTTQATKQAAAGDLIMSNKTDDINRFTIEKSNNMENSFIAYPTVSSELKINNNLGNITFHASDPHGRREGDVVRPR